MKKNLKKLIVLFIGTFISINYYKSQNVVVAGYTIGSIPVTNTVQQISVDHVGKKILLTGPSTTGKLDMFDISTQSTTTISTNWASNIINCWYPYSSTDVEYHNGYMYSCIPHNISSRDSIAKTNLSTGVSTLISLPNMPAGLSGIEGGSAFVGNKFYFTSPNASGAIFCLDMNTMAISTFSVGIPLVSYHTLEYNPVDDRLYVSAGNALYRVNLSTPTISLIGNLNSATFSQFALDPNGLYAWTQDGNNISKMSLATGQSTVIVNTLNGGIFQDLKFGPSTGSCNTMGASLYIGNNSNLLELKGFTNTIASLSVPTLTYCPGSTFKLPYLAVGNFCTGNIFTAQLSNAAGSFTAPISIGSQTTSSCADTLFCTIPSTLAAGTSYKVRVTSSTPTVTGFSSAMTLTIVAAPVPTISVNSGTICSGNSFTMIPSGAATYSYSSGNAVVSPTTTSSYSVIGTSSLGCVSPAAAVCMVTVDPLPIITVNSGAICIGNSFTINPGGANTYTISGGSAVVSPSTTTSYSVTGTTLLGCASSSAVISNVIVNALPVLNASTNTTLLCIQKTAILSATGANTFTWMPAGSGPNILISPSVTTQYTVMGTDANGCIGMDTLTQFVSACAGLAEYSNTKLSLSVYPNPFHTKVIFSINENGAQINSKLYVFNSLGSVIYMQQIESAKTEIDLQELPGGIYFIKLQGNRNLDVIKLIKE